MWGTGTTELIRGKAGGRGLCSGDFKMDCVWHGGVFS